MTQQNGKTMTNSSSRPRPRIATRLLCTALAASAVLAGCTGETSPNGAGSGGSTQNSAISSKAATESKQASEAPVAPHPSPAPAGYATTAENESSAAATGAPSTVPAAQTSTSDPSTSKKSFKPFRFTSIPTSYRQATSKGGRLETIEYKTSNPENPGTKITKKAVVYIPYGYRDNASKRYNILYLMHGSKGNERTWLGTQSNPTTAKYILDHMIADKRIAPTIVAMPTISEGHNRFSSTFPAFPSELTKDVMPTVEGKYRTYATATTPEAFSASRGHRAFGGFSLGGGATWSIFRNDLRYFQYFLPISGIHMGSVFSKNYNPREGVEDLAKAATKSGEGKRDYFIFAATGGDDSVQPYLSKMVNQMLQERKAFDYTDTSFANGNLTLFVVGGKGHNYTSAHTYLYNALPLFFR